MKIKVWAKRSGILVLILLAFWLARTDRYRFTPDTTFTTITGESFNLQSLQGRPVLITFWATSCGICVREIPDLIALYRDFHSLGLEIIAIAMTYDAPNRVVAMSEEYKLPYPIVLDLTASHAQAFGHVWATPTTFLLDSKGVVTQRTVGAFDAADLKSRIQQLLKG